MPSALEVASLSSESLLAVSIYCGINLLLLIVLGLNVSMKRRASQTSLGDGQNQALTCAIRAHGNHAEWFPGLMIGLVIAALIGIPGYALHAVGIAFTLARLLHAWGITRTAGLSFGRFAGSLITLICYLVLGMGLIIHGLI